METGRLDINGVIIAYGRRGHGAPLVLIHGYPLQGSIWERVAGLLEAEFDMIIPDLRGFGGSDAADAGRLMNAYAADVAGMMRALDLPKGYVVGHSMGGYAALALLRDHPEMLLGLGLVASQMLPDAPDRRQARYATAQAVLANGVGPVAETMSTKLSSDAAVQAAMRELILLQRPAGLASALEAMAERQDSTDLVAACKIPVVVVHGQADALIPVERGQEVKRVLPSAKYVELPRAGHMPMMEDPKAVAEALRFFLGHSQ